MNVVRFDGPGNSEPVWDASLPQDLRVAHTDSLFPTSLGQLLTNSPKRSKACGNLSPVAAKPSRKWDGTSFSCSLAEMPGVLFVDQPGKRSHSTLRANPPQRFAMPSHEEIHVLQVLPCRFVRFPENHIAPAHRDFGKHLSCRIVRDRKICPGIPVALPAFSVMLNHPSRTNAGQSEGFREVVDHSRLRQS